MRALNNPAKIAGRLTFLLACILLALLFLLTFTLNETSGAFCGSGYLESFHHYYNTEQYALLAQSLLDGHFWLDLPVANELLSLSDPYDFQTRFEIGCENIPIYWDYAFFEGKYYSYFGVVPAILFFAPYKLIFGVDLSTPFALGLIGLLCIAAQAFLVWNFGRHFFSKSISTISLCLALFVLFSATNLIQLAFVARFYSVPIMSALLLACLGYGLWIKSLRVGSKFSKCYLCLGSLCIALTLGCRPQFILLSFLGLALFKDEIFCKRSLFSRTSIKRTLAAILPFVIVVCLIGTYNYARFNSVFDFGSNYNLTGFNMTTYNQNWLLTIAFCAIYLFCPIFFTSEFPFVRPISERYLELGWGPHEPFFGGVLIIKPILLLSCGIPWFKARLKKHGLFEFVYLSIIFCLVVLVIDSRIAGLNERYISDFGLYIAFCSICVLFSAQAHKDAFSKTQKKLGACVISIFVVASLILGALAILSPLRNDSIAEYNPSLYSEIEEIFSTQN